MRVGVSADRESISQVKIIPTPKDFGQGVQALKQVANELSGGAKIEKIAGGIAGVLYKDKTGLAKSANVNDWVGKPLKTELERVFGATVKLENDAAIEGLGEANSGAGKNQGIIAFITIGTGVGGVRIINGKIDENALGFEPGHQIIVPDGNQCNCGGKGHLETYVAGSYIEKIYHKKAEEIEDTGIWNEIARYLSLGLTNVSVHWSPDIIVLGGSVSLSIPLEKVQGYLKEFLTVFPEAPQIIKASLGDEVGLYGALELLK